jgi:hypothetical protein
VGNRGVELRPVVELSEAGVLTVALVAIVAIVALVVGYLGPKHHK